MRSETRSYASHHRTALTPGLGTGLQAGHCLQGCASGEFAVLMPWVGSGSQSLSDGIGGADDAVHRAEVLKWLLTGIAAFCA